MALINYLTKIQFDFGALRLLPGEMSLLGIARPMLVTDKGIVACGLAQRLRDVLPAAMTVAVFDGTPENPTESAVKLAVAIYEEAGCDGVIAIGGGSSIDLAKGMALMTSHDGPFHEYAMIEGGVPRIEPILPPLIAVPTTAGTGSEVGRGTVITLNDGRKLTFVSPNIIPKVAICDPELTLGLPAGLTAATGMDAVTHCIENYLSPGINPPAEAIALDGLYRATRHIARAVAEGSDRQARWEMMMASMEGALSFQKGLGAVHAMSHPLGAIQEPRLHHGTLNAVILPTVLRFNKDHVGAKYARLRAVMGLPEDADLAVEIESLNKRLGLPGGLREMGARKEWIPDLAVAATKDHTNATNPRNATAADYEALFNQAM